ncbi:VOC family protein [Microbacteriaceae bacterium VKM Ac-2855]|nr:VOC family protein [Microbacteriaceae bacterium VKM Ac-2855]
MRFQTFSIFVDDQQKALDFYTGVLGFVLADDIPMGEFRWLTISSPDAPGGVQVSLEPKDHPAVAPFTSAIVADGLPFCSFGVDDVAAEHERLVAAGVRFTQEPTDLGPVTIAVLDDTVGNLIQLAQLN